MTPDPEVEQLIRDLSEPMGETAEEASFSLTSLGPRVVDPLIAAVHTLNRLGKLLAIEVFEEVGDRRAGPVLVELLDDGEDAVRQFAANALAKLRIADAIPALTRAYEATKRRGTPPHWTEPEAIRRALTTLGARTEQIPLITASLAVTTRDGLQAWPSARLLEVLNDLAANRQLVAYFQLWKVKADGYSYWIRGSGYEIDWSLPWRELLNAASRMALNAAAKVEPAADVVVSISWLNESDL